VAKDRLRGHKKITRHCDTQPIPPPPIPAN
jgi:hypothetical protein